MTRRKKQVNALRGTAGAWDQATEERFSEITSGTCRWQQGMIATCKDSSNEAKGRRRGEPEGMGAWVRKSDDRGVTSSKETEHVSPMQVTPAMGKGTLDPWWFHRPRGARTQRRDKPTCERELGSGQTTEHGAYANQRLNLAKLGRPRAEMPGFRTGPGKTGCPGLSGGLRKRSHGGNERFDP